ncbi:hypothetical protein C1H46_018881 [Malus baccata]|uniref:Uncharacterized protein n=1 Tax=Malus baccata TaxID=106549 RepID=A0A540M9V5_MALBA|nr:hypothetical protein C1H46_018881 [Malus baccata]
MGRGGGIDGVRRIQISRVTGPRPEPFLAWDYSHLHTSPPFDWIFFLYRVSSQTETFLSFSTAAIANSPSLSLPLWRLARYDHHYQPHHRRLVPIATTTSSPSGTPPSSCKSKLTTFISCPPKLR